MVRKFHDAYDKTDHPSKIRLLSIVRKIITFMDADLAAPADIPDAPTYGDNAPKAFTGLSSVAKLGFSESSDPFGLLLYTGFRRFSAVQKSSPKAPVFIDLTEDCVDPMAQGTIQQAPSGPPTSTEYEQAFHLMLNWGRHPSPFSRQFILKEWNFQPISKTEILDILGSPQKFETLLAERGPIWAGGFFEPGDMLPLLPGTRRVIEHSQSDPRWTVMFQLKEQLGNTHAIAILGIGSKEGTVLYRDPNLSNAVATLSFDQFTQAILPRLKEDAIALMYYDCPRCAAKLPNSCVQQPEKRLKATMGTVRAK